MDERVWRVTITWTRGPAAGVKAMSYVESYKELQDLREKFKHEQLEVIETLPCVMRAEMASLTSSGQKVLRHCWTRQGEP